MSAHKADYVYLPPRKGSKHNPFDLPYLNNSAEGKSKDISGAVGVLSVADKYSATEVKTLKKRNATLKKKLDKKQLSDTVYEKVPELFDIGLGVSEYLYKNNILYTALREAAKAVVQYFGKEQKVSLELVLGDSKDEYKLFASIQTELSAEDANKKLDEFDQNWWFKTPLDIRNYLEFSLEFI